LKSPVSDPQNLSHPFVALMSLHDHNRSFANEVKCAGQNVTVGRNYHTRRIAFALLANTTDSTSLDAGSTKGLNRNQRRHNTLRRRSKSLRSQLQRFQLR